MPRPTASPVRIRRRSEAAREALRAQLVDTAMRLFREGGERAVSMRLLAREAGISTMALYTYFPTKAHLMQHIWADVLRLACAQGEQAAAASPCDWSRLDACLQGFLSYWADHLDHLREILRAWQAEGDGQGPPPWFLAQRLQLDLLLRPLSQAPDEETRMAACRDQVLTQMLGAQMMLLAHAQAPRATRQRLIEHTARVTLASLRAQMNPESAAGA
jgi:AcrR family transcriptional regulator